MNPLLSRPLGVVVLAASLLPVTGASSAGPRPHPQERPISHTVAVGRTTPFPTTGLAVGDVPTIPYAFASSPEPGEGHWRLRRPDGTSLRLPRLTWSTWAPMGQGAIGMAGTEAGPELQRVLGSGAVRSRMVRHFGLAVSPGREVVGWLGDHGRPQVVEGGGTRRLAMPRVVHGSRIAAIWAAQTCREEYPEGGGCTVFVQRGRRTWVSTSHGIVTRVGPVLRVSDVNRRGRVLGLVSRRRTGHPDCWGVFGPDGRRVFRTCHYRLHAFSPDGRLVLAERSGSGFFSVRRFAVLGRDGHVIRSWTFAPGRHRTLTQLTWEDRDHLLGVLWAHGRWGLVRIGTDGTVEHAGPAVDLAGELTPYSLPVR